MGGLVRGFGPQPRRLQRSAMTAISALLRRACLDAAFVSLMFSGASSLSHLHWAEIAMGGSGGTGPNGCCLPSADGQ